MRSTRMSGRRWTLNSTASDGDDTLLNFAATWDAWPDGGNGTDILQNSGNDIYGSLELTGGAGKNTLQNFGNRIGVIN